MPLAETDQSGGVAQTPPAVQNRPGQPRAAVPQATAERDEDRSVQLEQVAQQADRGDPARLASLAGRGAYFAARAEFIGAIRLVAAALG